MNIFQVWVDGQNIRDSDRITFEYMNEHNGVYRRDKYSGVAVNYTETLNNQRYLGVVVHNDGESERGLVFFNCGMIARGSLTRRK